MKGDGNGQAEPLTRIAELTSSFYRWEMRGRGWAVWPEAVDLEPPFVPFSHGEPRRQAVDDARQSGLIRRWLERMFGIYRSSEEQQDEEPDEPAPDTASSFNVVEIQFALAPDVKVSAEIAEHFLLALNTAHPVSFEIIGSSEAITTQLACAEVDAPQVREQLRAYFPDAVIAGTEGFLAAHWKTAQGEPVLVDFGLSQEFMRPLKTFDRFDADPLIAVTGAMADLTEGEVAVLQVLLHSAQAPWPASILRSVSDLSGEPFFIDAPELLSNAREKVKRPLFGTAIRVAIKSQGGGRSWDLARWLGGALVQLSDPPSNELIALDNEGYSSDDHESDVLKRRTHRSGCLLNSEELASLAHPPSASVRSPRLAREQRRTKAVPRHLLGQGVVLGTNTHGGVTGRVSLSLENRLRHMHVVGASGTGKSTFLLNLLVQDMQEGHGMALLDPHGDLVDEVLSRVPDNRISDVVLVDPADAERPIPFNILSAHSDLEKTLLASDLVAVFRRLSTSWGDQMTSVLSNAVLAFLESSRGGTLADLRRFLVEAEFRKEFLQSVADREVVYFWEKEFPLLAGRPQAPLLTRLDAFLRPRLVRNMVGRPDNRLDFASIMDEGKILLVKLSQGAIGEENAALLGTLFVAKIHQLALGRQAVSETERRPFYLYIDEFQHFVTPSMATLLTSARKCRIGLVLAHQELRQLWNQNRDVAGAVMANAATRVCFRVGDDDARVLENSFGAFTARDLQNLSVGQAICKVDRADQDFSLDTPLPEAIPMDAALERRGNVTRLSRERYGVPAPASSEPASVMAPEEASPVSVESKPPRNSRRATAAPPRAESLSGELKQGRGGAQHKYLQELIRRWGEANGWRATIEQPVLEGLGQVDVALEREGVRVACEIAVSSTVDYEISNVRKGLSAGFDHVIVVAVDKRSREHLASRITREGLGAAPSTAVHLSSPEEVFRLLSQLSTDRVSERTTAGYRVTVKRGGSVDDPSRTQGVARTVLAAVKRLRSK